ncbi:MAG: radical SAM protein [Microcoleus sp.]
MIATRGCPHQCDYCTIPWIYPRGRQMRFRPVEEVAAEVAAIPDKGIIAELAPDEVIIFASVNEIVAFASLHDIIADATTNDVPTATTKD